MITYYLVIIIIGALGLIILPLTALPTATLDPRIATALQNAGNQLHYVYVVIPYTLIAIFAILAVMLMRKAIGI